MSIRGLISRCLFLSHAQVSVGYSVLEAVTARYTGLRGELGEVSECNGTMCT